MGSRNWFHTHASDIAMGCEIAFAYRCHRILDPWRVRGSLTHPSSRLVNYYSISVMWAFLSSAKFQLYPPQVVNMVDRCSLKMQKQ